MPGLGEATPPRASTRGGSLPNQSLLAPATPTSPTAVENEVRDRAPLPVGTYAVWSTRLIFVALKLWSTIVGFLAIGLLPGIPRKERGHDNIH
jgi:hypothetical protein